MLSVHERVSRERELDHTQLFATEYVATSVLQLCDSQFIDRMSRGVHRMGDLFFC